MIRTRRQSDTPFFPNMLNNGNVEVCLKEDVDKEIRRLRRALYKACAEWALSTIAWLDCIDQGNPIKWGEMRRKCIEKVEEFK